MKIEKIISIACGVANNLGWFFLGIAAGMII